MTIQHFHWQSSSQSNVGNIRSLNEDAFLERPDLQLWAVADGMGGHHGGEIASRMVVDSLNDLNADARSMSEFVDSVESSLVNTNNALIQLSEEQFSSRTVGSTVVCLLAYNGFIAYLWAGDSRVYRYRRGEFQQLTSDHSEVQRLVDEGLIDPINAESHPAANIVTKAIGGQPNVAIQLGLDNVEEDDMFLLCSDGLYRDIPDNELATFFGKGSVDETCNTLIQTALSRTGADNVTAIVMRATS